MTNEQKLLKQLVLIKDSGITYPYEEIMTLERELAKLYMPQLDEFTSDESLIKWGIRFKDILKEKEKMFREDKGI